VLREAAIRLTGGLRADDTVARLGNGRFLLLFPNIRHSDDCARLARKIQETFSSPFTANGRDLYLTISLGLAMYPEDGGEENELGTGYSSLNYLKQLPIDRIKIDHSFVRDLELGRNDAALVGLIAEIARKMGLSTLAEGVETPAQRDMLQACRCNLMQGYLFSPPVTAEAFSALLRSASGNFSRGV